ncbi:MAG: hypothetical protein DMF63_11190 [Acidobacteria bacterium]|nr:MAG: hypothetical protein DMF63_11190 [Acidobacteriota bacterium]
MNQKHLIFLAAFCIVTAVAAVWYAAPTFAGPTAAANGSGSLTNGIQPNGRPFKRQFSFSARTSADGTVTGNAILHSAFDDGAHGNQPYALQIDISCMRVVGNVAFFGGTTRRTTDPNLVDAVYFSIEDNGNPGANNDRLSLAYFFDDDPGTMGDPQLCQQIPLGTFPMETINSGNISLR